MPASPTKAMIYVVDDDLDVLGSLQFLFETDGFAVRTFKSGLPDHSRLHRELRWLGSLLGNVRDPDVQLALLSAYEKQQDAEPQCAPTSMLRCVPAGVDSDGWTIANLGVQAIDRITV